MKKTYYILAFVFSIALFTSCKKEDNSQSSGSSSTSNSSVLASGTWKVTYYHHNSDDNTADFSSYTFTFSSSGAMTAVSGTDTTNGTWSRDDSHNELHFSIGSSTPLNKLTSGWTIISSTSTAMVLKDDSGATEEVHFSKI